MPSREGLSEGLVPGPHKDVHGPDSLTEMAEICRRIKAALPSHRKSPETGPVGPVWLAEDHNTPAAQGCPELGPLGEGS